MRTVLPKAYKLMALRRPPSKIEPAKGEALTLLVESAATPEEKEAARQAGVPVASHVAETLDEATFLTTHSGPFRRLWSIIGGWDDRVLREAPGTTAIERASTPE